MIRTAIILSPRQEAADRLYFHANGLQIDVATASQSIVRTSHRPVQIYSATRSGFRQQASNLTAQTGFQGQRWQRLMDILDRQGSDALQGLFTDGELTGEWIAALDDRRLNALLSERFSFYLFRGGNLRELRPIAQLLPIDNGLPMNLYRIRIAQDDQIMIMPKELITPTLLPDVMQILLGMHQLPVRMSELGARLRERGVTTPYTGWLALQVLRAEAEYTIPERGLRAWLIGRRRSVDNEKGLGFSDSFTTESTKSSNDPDNEDDREIEAGRNTFPSIRSAPQLARLIVIFVIGIALPICHNGHDDIAGDDEQHRPANTHRHTASDHDCTNNCGATGMVCHSQKTESALGTETDEHADPDNDDRTACLYSGTDQRRVDQGSNAGK
jgi:hypothetical protein